jgi:hypothetical protein
VKTVTSKYALKVSRGKKKTKTFKEKDPARIQIVINNNITEQTSNLII